MQLCLVTQKLGDFFLILPLSVLAMLHIIQFSLFIWTLLNNIPIWALSNSIKFITIANSKWLRNPPKQRSRTVYCTCHLYQPTTCILSTENAVNIETIGNIGVSPSPHCPKIFWISAITDSRALCRDLDYFWDSVHCQYALYCRAKPSFLYI